MKSWSQALAFCMLFSLPVQAQAPQLPKVRATLKDMSVTQCRQGKSPIYDYRVSMTFLVENLSDSPLLVAKEIGVVTSEAVASSEENAKGGVYSATIVEEYMAGKDTGKEPVLKDFIVVRPGKPELIKFSPLILITSTEPREAGSLVLQQGKHWLKLHFSLLPEYFMFNSSEQLRAKWKSIGQLDSQIISTEPFPLEIVLNPKSRRCESH